MNKYIIASAANSPMIGHTELGLVESNENGDVLLIDFNVVPERIHKLPSREKFRYIKGYDESTNTPIYPTEKTECVVFFPHGFNGTITKRRSEIILIDQTPRSWEDGWDQIKNIKQQQATEARHMEEWDYYNGSYNSGEPV